MTPSLRCLVPFTYLELAPGGEVYCCCPQWTKAGPIGNLKKEPIEKIWNSVIAERVRSCVYAHNLEIVCNQKYCPIFLGQKKHSLPKWLKVEPGIRPILNDLREKKTHLSSGPIDILVADSGQCNLRCKMCLSNEKFIPNDDNLSKKIFEEVLPKLLPSARYLTLCGNGEVFYRQQTREFLRKFNPRKYPQLSFNILSNGILLNQRMWDSIKHNRINSISISIDAATKQTYNKIRLGGNWERLQKNLLFLAKLRRQVKFKSFRINMVVMRSNYHEMKQFARLGIRLGCDTVLFSKIYGHFTLGCLQENINFLRGESKIFQEIRKILSDPIFKHPAMNTVQLANYKNYRLTPEERLTTRLNHLKRSLLFPLYRLYYLLPRRYRPFQYLKVKKEA